MVLLEGALQLLPRVAGASRLVCIQDAVVHRLADDDVEDQQASHEEHGIDQEGGAQPELPMAGFEVLTPHAVAARPSATAKPAAVTLMAEVTRM